MRLVPIDQVTPDMRLGQAVQGEDGRVLLQAGVLLHPEYIRRLKELGYAALYVLDGIADDLVLPQVIRAETRQAAMQQVRAAIAATANNQKLQIEGIRRSVESMIEEILASRELIVALVDIKSLDNNLFAHCVNVAVLSLIVGKTLGYSHQQLYELGIGAMLHDIGKCRVDQQILNKPGRLTPAEYDQVKKHAEYGFEMLRNEYGLSTMSAHIAFQHHERMDGSGYPRRLKGTEIIEYARIVAVCDMFDSMTSDQVYRLRLTHAEALQVIQSQAGTKLDSWIVRKFCNVVVPYPLATLVKLSDGQIALVISVNPEQLDRPGVKIMRDAAGRSLGNRGAVLDLANHPALSIVGPADWDSR